MDLQSDENSHLIKEEDEDNEERCSSCFHFPRAIYFIILIELCERFNYYGMRTILILYLTQHLLLSEGNAVSIYHFFISLCYITTILGSFIADNYIGKYKTLIIIGVIYTVGSTLMSLTAIPARNISGPFISLILIAFGTGGVKACVGPFGGDQIPPNKKNVLNRFFSVFYFAINLGALLSTILTPILRANVACNHSDDCYPLAFGVPAILMVLALVILLIGRPFYIDVPIKEDIYIRAIKCIILSIKSWFRDKSVDTKKKLLDYSSNEYDAVFIRDMRTIYRISILYLPLPIYWALFDQIGSRWTLQAAQMDGEVASNFIILPDQMSLLNVIFIMALIPLFDTIIYPLCHRIIPPSRPLRRMTIGMAITSLSFIAAFILQNQIEVKQPPKIFPTYSRLVLVNSLPCDTSIYVNNGAFLNAGSFQTSDPFLDLQSGSQLARFEFKKCTGIENPQTLNENVIFYPGRINFLVVEMDNFNRVNVQIIHDLKSPNIKGHPLIRLAASGNIFNNYNFQLKEIISGKVVSGFSIISNQSLYISNWKRLAKHGRFIWTVKSPFESSFKNISHWTGVLISKKGSFHVDSLKITSSEVSIFYMSMINNKESVVVIPLIINSGSQISILWQIPQYILISIGEILVSITGLSFSYDQAPAGMKSLVNALWFTTVSVGNIVVIVIAKIHFVDKQSFEYLIFGVLCMVFCFIFSVLAFFYQMNMKEEIIQLRPLSPDDKTQ